MADINANIGIEIDASSALSQLKSLQRQISQFHTSISKSSEAAALAQRSLQKNLVNSINSLGTFSAELRTVRTTSESFSNSLEKNKFSMGQYFKYAAASTKTFGSLFRSEFDTITKVAEDRVKKLNTQYIKMGRDATGAMKAIAVIPNELDMSNLNTQMQMAAQRQALFNQLVKQGSTNLLNFGKNTQWAGRQLMVGFTLPLVTLGTTASRVFTDMETAAIKFRKVYGDLFTPQEETKQALDSIKELGREFTKYGIAVSETVGVAAEAAAAGFQGLDLQRQTTAATRLSILGQITQQKALETTISLQNALRISSQDLGSSIDFLNAVENQTVVSLDDITTAIPKVAPVIQQLGGDVKDLAFFMAAMKEGGVNASEGANALKSGLASLINPTTKASAMLASMGINIDKIVQENKGNLRATVIEFATALNQLDPLQRAQAIEQLFGKFQFARLSTLFDNVTRQGNQASRVLDLAGASVQELAALSEQELGITADSAMNKFRKSVEDLKFALVPVGEEFLKAATPLLEFVTKLIDKFNGLGENTKRIITILTVTIGGLGPVILMTFGLLANAVANIVKLGLVLRNSYLKLTGQSQLLGNSTEYLTMEQIDAAAAAASLDQAHSNLTQQFVLEDKALQDLITTYQRALTASQKFAATNPGMIIPTRTGRRPVRRSAGGEISGPGTSKSDSIPAFLSNGEYVVNASAVDKYGVEFFDAVNAQRFSGGGQVLNPVQKGHIVTDERGYMVMMESWLNQIIRKNSSGATGSVIAKGLSRTESRTGFHPVSLLASMIDDMEKSGFTFSGNAKGASKDLYNEILKKLRTSYSGIVLGGRGNRSLESMITEEILLDPKNPLSKIMVTSPGGNTASLHDVLMSPTTLRDTSGSAKSRGWGFFSGNKIAVTPAEKILQEFTGGVGRGTSAAGYFTTSRTLSKRQLLSMLSFGKFGNAISKFGIKSKNLTNIFTQMRNNKGKGFLGALSSIFKNGVKANNGLLSVPGKGNTDTVPAMLTPGEAVIPKKQNKKYAALVQGIIADNIPGFVRGSGKIRKSGAASRKGKALAGVPAMRGANSANPQGLLNFANVNPDDMFAVTSLGLEDIIQREKISLSKVDKEFADWSKGHQDLIKKASERVTQGTSVEEAYKDVSEKFNRDMDQLGGETARLNKAAKKHYPRLRKDLVQAQTHAKKMGLNIRKASDNAKLVADLPENAIAQGLGNTRGNYQTRGGLRGAISSMFGGSKEFGRTGIPRRFIDPNRIKELRDYELSLEHVNTTEEQMAARSKQSGQKPAIAQINAGVPEDRRSQSIRSLYGTGPTDAEAKSIRRQQEKIARRTEREAKKQQSIDKKIAENKQRIYGHTGEITAIERARRKQAEKNQRDLDRAEKTRIKAELEATKNVTDTTKSSRMRRAGKIIGGAATAGVMTAAMVAPQGSMVSEIANMAYIPLILAQMFQKPLVKAGEKLLSFGKLIGLTATRLTVIGTAISAGIFLFKKYSDAQKEGVKKLEAFSIALTTTEDQKDFIKNTFGVTLQQSALELFKAGNAPTSITRRTQLEDIKANKDFQKTYADTIGAVRNMNPQQALSALRFKGFELMARGMAPEQVQLLIDAIKEEAGKQNIVLDFGSIKFGPQVFKQMNKDTASLLKDFQKQYEKGFTGGPGGVVTGGKAGGGRTYAVNPSQMTKEFKAYLKNLGAALGSQMNIISTAFSNGMISAKQFNAQIKLMFNNFKMNGNVARDTAQQTLLIRSALQQVSPELAKSISGVQSLSNQYLILQAAMSGYYATQQDIAILSRPAQDQTDRAEQAAARNRINQGMKQMEKIIADANKTPTLPPTTGTPEKEKTLIELIKEKTKALVNQSKAFKYLRLAGIEASVAAEFASDPQFAAKIRAAAEKGGQAWRQATAEIKEYARQQKIVEKMLIAGADQGDYEAARLEMAQKYIELQEHLIDMQNAPTLKKYNDELATQEEELNKINQQIDEIMVGKIDPKTGKFVASAYAEANAQIRENEYALAQIEVQEDAINEKYDKQIDALQKIAQINEDIAAIEKGRIDLADALSRGDLSAAAAAVIDIRRQEASRQAASGIGILETARGQELNALGRSSLEKQNRDLQLQILGIENDRIIVLEKQKVAVEAQIASINNNISVLEKQIDVQKSVISYFGMTKDQIDMAARALDLAKSAGVNINDPAFLNNILRGAKGDADALKLSIDAVAKAARDAFADLEKMRSNQFNLSTTTTQTAPIGSEKEKDKEPPVDIYNIMEKSPLAKANEDYFKTVVLPAVQDGTANGSILSDYVNAVKQTDPKYRRPGFQAVLMSSGGFVPRGTDTVPAMLTPGEFVVNRRATQKHKGLLEAINSGNFSGVLGKINAGSLYAPRYSVSSANSTTYSPNINSVQSSTNNNTAVYNYSVTVNSSGTNTNPNGIAKSVIDQIRYIDSQRIRGQ